MKKVCIPIVETDPRKALRAVEKANRLADLIELRVGYLREQNLELLLNKRKKPFIVTNRRKEEGGRYTGDEKKRLEILKEAVDLGAEYIDVEIGIEKPLIQELISNKKRTQIILSSHNFKGTPSLNKLKSLVDRVTQRGAHIGKIVTFARMWEDNLKILSLIPYAKEKKQRIVAFCMGEKGKVSRVFAPLMGAEWTYASLDKKRTSAPGQLTVFELREIWERLTHSTAPSPAFEDGIKKRRSGSTLSKPWPLGRGVEGLR